MPSAKDLERVGVPVFSVGIAVLLVLLNGYAYRVFVG